MFFIFLVGCSSEFKPDTFSEKDFGIHKVNDENAKVHYGMTRFESEKVLGTGEETYLDSVIYENGVVVSYSNEKVVGLSLNDESRGFYRTSRGVEVGISKEKLLELFGEKYAIETPEGTLDYMYNIEDERLLSADFLKSVDKKYEENTYLFTIFFDTDETIDSLYLIDHRLYEKID